MFRAPILSGVVILLLAVPGAGTAPRPGTGDPGQEEPGKTGKGNEAARPLQGRALDNVVAFTRLLGHVRYFHPSDEAAATDWERFALDGLPVVEKARDAG